MILIELMNELHSAEEIYRAEKFLESINIIKKGYSSKPKPKGKGKKKARKKRPFTKQDGKPKGKCFKCGQKGKHDLTDGTTNGPKNKKIGILGDKPNYNIC